MCFLIISSKHSQNKTRTLSAHFFIILIEAWPVVFHQILALLEKDLHPCKIPTIATTSTEL